MNETNLHRIVVAHTEVTCYITAEGLPAVVQASFPKGSLKGGAAILVIVDYRSSDDGGIASNHIIKPHPDGGWIRSPDNCRAAKPDHLFPYDVFHGEIVSHQKGEDWPVEIDERTWNSLSSEVKASCDIQNKPEWGEDLDLENRLAVKLRFI